MQHSQPRAGSCGPAQGGTSSGGPPGFHQVHLTLVAYLCDWVYIATFKKKKKNKTKTKNHQPESCKELYKNSSLIQESANPEVHTAAFLLWKLLHCPSLYSHSTVFCLGKLQYPQRNFGQFPFSQPLHCCL